MQSQDLRLASFNAVLKPKSKAKPAWPLSSATHPHLTPQRLAKAGFFHTPGKDADAADVVTCFLCQLVLGGWDEDDDPDAEHVKRGGCAWAKLVCDQDKDRTTYTNEEDLPSSSQAQASRIATYGKWWPHKLKAGWLPTVSNLARAGFIYAPSSESPDAVTCPHCSYAVEGWEATDDAWEIHRAKVPHCPFFTATLASTSGPVKKAKARPTKSVAGSSAPSGSRRTKRTQAPEESGTENEPELQPEATPAPETEASSSKASRRTTKASSKRSASAKSTAAASDTEELEVAPVSKRSAKSRAAVAAATAAAEDEIVEAATGGAEATSATEASAPASKRSAKSKASEDEGHSSAPAQSSKKSASATSRGKAKAVETEHRPKSEQEVRTEVAIVPKAKAKAKVKATKAKAAPKAKKQAKSKVKDGESQETDASEVELASASEAEQASEIELETEPEEPAAEVVDQPTPKASQKAAPASPSPPPVPSKDTPRARPIRPLSSATKGKASPRTALPRPVLDKSVEEGAVAARQTMIDLLSPKVGAPVGGPAVDEPLTTEQEDMTVEELVRHEMALRYSELERQGEESIAKWLERTRGARERIESV